VVVGDTQLLEDPGRGTAGVEGVAAAVEQEAVALQGGRAPLGWAPSPRGSPPSPRGPGSRRRSGRPSLPRPPRCRSVLLSHPYPGAPSRSSVSALPPRRNAPPARDTGACADLVGCRRDPMCRRCIGRIPGLSSWLTPAVRDDRGVFDSRVPPTRLCAPGPPLSLALSGRTRRAEDVVERFARRTPVETYVYAGPSRSAPDEPEATEAYLRRRSG
jgi:hypothetical protein